MQGEAEEIMREGGRPAGSEEVEAEDGKVAVRQAKEQMFSDKITYVELKICNLLFMFCIIGSHFWEMINAFSLHTA